MGNRGFTCILFRHMIGDWLVFLLIQPYQHYRYAGLLEQSFRLRKRVFHDCLGWQVDVHHGLERDAYDGLGAVYLVWCDKDAHHLYGTVRLMPTTGPTLLHDVFRRTVEARIWCLQPHGKAHECALMSTSSERLNRRSAHLERLGSFCWPCSNAPSRMASKHLCQTTSRQWREYTGERD